MPGLTLLEVTSALRRLVQRDALEEEVAAAAVRWLPTFVVKHRPIGQSEAVRIWELRNTVTPYDAAYVALTETLQSELKGNVVLVTADQKLAGAPGVSCPIELYTTGE